MQFSCDFCLVYSLRSYFCNFAMQCFQMVAELQNLPLPFILWQHGYKAPTHRSCNYANFGESKNNVSLSVRGLQEEHEESLEMHARKEEADSNKSLAMRSSSKAIFNDNQHQ